MKNIYDLEKLKGFFKKNLESLGVAPFLYLGPPLPTKNQLHMQRRGKN